MHPKVIDCHTTTTLDQVASDAWNEDGLIRFTGLVPNAVLAHVRERLTALVGYSPENPLAFPRLGKPKLKPLGREPSCVIVDSETVSQVVGQLLGTSWSRPNSGGSWFISPPRGEQTTEPPREGWHWDGRPDLHGCTGLWVFAMLADLPFGAGGTWMMAGSHQIVSDFYGNLPMDRRGQPSKKVRRWFSDQHTWFDALNGADDQIPESESPRIFQVSGQAGDVVFMRSLTIHARPRSIGPGPRQIYVCSTEPSKASR